jgi:hypothetical protein
LNRCRKNLDNEITLERGINKNAVSLKKPKTSEEIFEFYRHLYAYKYVSNFAENIALDVGCGVGYGVNELSNRADICNKP